MKVRTEREGSTIVVITDNLAMTMDAANAYADEVLNKGEEAMYHQIKKQPDGTMRVSYIARRKRPT